MYVKLNMLFDGRRTFFILVVSLNVGISFLPILFSIFVGKFQKLFFDNLILISPRGERVKCEFLELFYVKCQIQKRKKINLLSVYAIDIDWW